LRHASSGLLTSTANMALHLVSSKLAFVERRKVV
jgi:hypothetical protein